MLQNTLVTQLLRTRTFASGVIDDGGLLRTRIQRRGAAATIAVSHSYVTHDLMCSFDAGERLSDGRLLYDARSSARTSPDRFVPSALTVAHPDADRARVDADD